eukprot:2542825-Prymnesium_polylepis.1
MAAQGDCAEPSFGNVEGVSLTVVMCFFPFGFAGDVDKPPLSVLTSHITYLNHTYCIDGTRSTKSAEQGATVHASARRRLVRPEFAQQLQVARISENTRHLELLRARAFAHCGRCVCDSQVTTLAPTRAALPKGA